MADIDQEAYDSYFDKTPSNIPPVPIVIPNETLPYTYEQFKPETTMVPITTQDIPLTDTDRFISESNVSDLDQLGAILKKLTNATWGHDWGTISPEFAKGENPEQPLFPQITYDTNNRESSEGKPIKPMKFDTIKEVVNGALTGDAFDVYRQWFDSIIEFNFWGRTTLESRQIMTNFESVMGTYAGYLKKEGISEVFFLKEIPSKLSTKYIEGISMRCLMFYIRFEKIQTVRHSLLTKINLELSTGTDVIRTQLSTGQ